MTALNQPGLLARRGLLRRALGAGVAALAGTSVARAEDSKAEVAIDNFTFTPALLRVKKGTEATWVNHDDIPHSIVCAALNMHSHAMDTDGTFSYRFEKVGTFTYICGLHPHMKGKVVVTA